MGPDDAGTGSLAGRDGIYATSDQGTIGITSTGTSVIEAKGDGIRAGTIGDSAAMRTLARSPSPTPGSIVAAQYGIYAGSATARRHHDRRDERDRADGIHRNAGPRSSTPGASPPRTASMPGNNQGTISITTLPMRQA